MGYFSNSDAGMAYEAQWCASCHHYKEGGCAVLLAHMLHNYDQCNDDDGSLHVLIPQSKDGLGNLKCRMHITETERRGPRKDKRQASMFKEGA